MSDVACVIVVCAYRRQNMGYVNNSLTQLMMVDGSFSPIESLTFEAWNFLRVDKSTSKTGIISRPFHK